MRNTSPRSAEVPEIDAGAAAAAIGTAGALAVDVRERAEWTTGHIPGAVHLPLGGIVARAAEIPRDRSVILVCQVGARSYRATQALLDLGYQQVMNLDGGMLAWEEAGLPIKRS